MSVFYKFKSSLGHDTIQFDDLHISLQDFKKAVINQKQFGKNRNFDLQVTNAETNEVYSEENSLIPKNSSLIVVRVPIAGSQKKTWEGDQLGSKIGVLSSDGLQENAGNIAFKSADLSALNASEHDKIQAMMMQSNIDYDSSNYLKVKGGSQYGELPPNYVCHKCQRSDHWIKDCPRTIAPDIKKSSGIPQSFMTPVEGPSVPGALMTPTGTFAVPTIDLQAYKEGKKEKPFIPSEETEEVSKPIIPEDLTCSLCQDLLTDAVMIPCCATTFCDDCIRNTLIETEDNQCPYCKEKDNSPETLIPNRFLRNAVNNFRNKTGYRGGGQRIKQSEAQAEPSKSPAIENDDVEIIATISNEIPVKPENEPEKEMGSAIAVLGQSGPSSQLHRTGARIPTNGTQNKMPTIHVEHRPPMGRPPKHLQNETNNGGDAQRSLVNNGIKQETVIDVERSSPLIVPHVPPPALPDRNRMSCPPPPLNPSPNSATVPGVYNQQPIPPMGALPPYPGGVPPMMPNYGHPPGVNPMVMPPQHMANQSNVRMYHYPGQPMYNPQMNDRGGFHSGPNRGIRMHRDEYQDRNIVDAEAFVRRLREREKQDEMRRNRSRRTRSRSHSRGRTRSISRSRSRSRSPLKKRSSTKTPPSMRKESPSIKREFRSPVGGNRSRSNSRGRARLRSRSRSPVPRSDSISPTNAMKNKRSVSLSPSAIKKHSRSPSLKKSLRMNRSRSRSRTRSRSKSLTRSRKRRRSRTRSRSVSSRRSFSRGRSYSRSVSPRSRRYYSPSRTSHRAKRSSRSPRQHSSRYRSTNSNYKDGSPFVSGSYYESNDYRGYNRRGGRNQRFQRGGGRYSNSNQNYDYGNKHERYSNDRYDDKRYAEHQRPYYNDHSRNRKETYYQTPTESYDQYQNSYPEVPPPGTTDPLPSLGYNANLTYDDSSNMYNVRNDKYRSPEYLASDNVYQSHNLKPLLEEDWLKSSKDRDQDHYRRKSRENYHYPDAEHERRHDNRLETDRERRHDSRPETDRERRHDNRSEADRERRHDSRSENDRERRPGSRSETDRERRHENKSETDRDRKHGSRSETDRDRRHESRTRYTSASPSRSEKKHRSHGHSTDKDKSRSERSAKTNIVNEKHAEYDRSCDTKPEASPEKDRSRKEDDKKDDHKEKKDKSKRKKKKDSDAEKKKKKKVKAKKEDDHKVVDDTKSSHHEGKQHPAEEPVNDKVLELDVRENDLYDGMEDTKVDKKIIESYIQIDKPEEHVGEKRPENVVLAPVPELSKWERDEDISSDDTKILISDSAVEYADNKKVVTNEILKRAENVLFQKAVKIPNKSNDTKIETHKDNEDLILPENPREARKSGNSLQITVPVGNNKVEEEKPTTSGGRISAKDRLGAKVDDKYSSIRSAAEPKKPPVPVLKSVVDVKQLSSKSDSQHKPEKRDDSRSRKHEDRKHEERKHEDKKRKESRHGESKHHSKHRDSKENKDKKRRKSVENDVKPKKEHEEKEPVEKELPRKEPFAEKKDNVQDTDNSINDVKTMLEKKRPSLDEASFEPDYDLTSESEEEGETKSVEEDKPKRNVTEPVKDIKPGIDKELIKKLIEHTRTSSSETTSDSSTDSSVERKKHKKKKTKKRSKTKKRRNYSSDSDSDESSESESDSDVKHKRKKKHKHKNKKTRTAKKKKKSKHRS